MKKNLLTLERKEDRLLLSVAVFTASFFFLFGPLQMYLSNISELWFSFSDTLISCFIGFAIAMVVLTLLGALLCFWKVPFYCYLLFIWGIGLALYLQGNLVPMKGGILNGADVNWNAYQKEAWFSIVLWTSCVILPFLLVRFFPNSWKKIIQNFSIAIFSIQLVTAILLCVTTDLTNTKKTDYLLSAEGLYNVGEGKNVVFFVLDSYDQQFFEKVHEQERELTDFLDGFTWFTNATNVYPCTAPSIRYLLTNQLYFNDRTVSDYTAESWELCDSYYRSLQEEGFEISIYTSEDKAVSETAKASFVKNAKNQQLRVSSHTALTQSLLRLTAIRFFPDILKRYVWVSDYNSLFEPLKETEDDVSAYTWENATFYQGLIDQGLSLVKNNQFHFIHLRGVHNPHLLLEDLTVDSDAALPIDEMKACLKIMREYCSQLEAMGIYDNTCIIITADHGSYDRSMGTPIFLVKKFNQRGALSFSDVPVSHENLMSTVAEELLLDSVEQYGVSVFDVKKDNTEPRRYFRHNLFGSHEVDYLPTMVEYTVQSENNSPESFIYTGKAYTPDGMYVTTPYQCEIGKPIQFNDIQALQYFISGVPIYIEHSKTIWLQEKEVRMRFAFDHVDDSLTCHISLDPFIPGDQQRFIVTWQGTELYRGEVVSGMTEINFIVPNYCIADGVLELNFHCPDGMSKLELGLGNETEALLSLPVHQILFTKDIT